MGGGGGVPNLSGISGCRDSAEGNAEEKGQLETVSSQHSPAGAGEWGTGDLGRRQIIPFCTFCTSNGSMLFSQQLQVALTLERASPGGLLQTHIAGSYSRAGVGPENVHF